MGSFCERFDPREISERGGIDFLLAHYSEPALRLSAITEFLESHQNGFTSEEFRQEVLWHIPIELAIEDWIATLKVRTTRNTYRHALNVMLHKGGDSNVLREFITNKSSIMDLDEKSACNGIYNAIDMLDISERKKRIVRSSFSSFANYIRTITQGYICAEPYPKQQKEYEKVCAIKDVVDWDSFISLIEEPYGLIAEMVFLSACACEYRIKLADPKFNVFDLDTTQIDFKKGEIAFERHQSYHVDGCRVCFPKEYMDKLRKHLCGRKGRVFNTALGRKVFPSQVRLALERASKKYGHNINAVMITWAGVVVSRKNRK